MIPSFPRLVPFLLLTLLPVGCARPPAPPPPAAEKPKVEQDLARTRISPEAFASLQIRSEPLHSQVVREQAQLTGWVMARQGNEVTLTAEVAGYVREPADARALPAPGLPVRHNQELFQLEPVLTPLEQLDLAAKKRLVEGEWIKAKESLVVAEKEWERIEGLFKQKLRAEQDLEQARARLNSAKEDLATAEYRLSLYGGRNGARPASENGNGPALVQLRPRPVLAPRAGTVLAVHASPGQYVQLGAPLVTVADLSQLWLRVPVPENDLPRLDRQQSANVQLRPTGAGKESGKDLLLPVRPVAVVPQVDAVRHTADLIYELPSEAAERGVFAKDQMVPVRVPLHGERAEKEFVVPYSAVVFDGYGSAWIYFDLTPADAKEHLFERRRVELGANVELAPNVYKGVHDAIAVHLDAPPGNRIVTAGAAQLFSREFHKPPVPTPSK